MPTYLKSQKFGLTIFKRSQAPDAKYLCRLKFKNTTYWVTLCETEEKSFSEAVRARRALHEGRFSEWRAIAGLRRDKPCSTIGELTTAYDGFKGHDRPADATRTQNINALEEIIRSQVPDFGPSLSLSKLTADLLWHWKESKRQAAELAGDDERKLQILRSANSRLRQARSLFADNEDLRAYYRHAGVVFPDSIKKFCDEPGFADVAKEEYHAPDDTIIAATFAAIELLLLPNASNPTIIGAPHPDNLNMFKAIWLAVGFGLRKSEIAAAKNGWFITVNGATWCRGDELAKNKKFPEVRCQLGAWSKLSPYINPREPDAHVLAGSASERTDITFRRISEWMRTLKWQTTHHIHEFRAWAGCQIAMAQDLRAAQVFLRHASYATTEKHYGHHLKTHLDEVQLKLPIAAATQPFTPVILR